MAHKKRSRICMMISIILILISILATSLIQTNFGKVEVTKINIATPEGQNVAALLYTPKDASAENKLPLIICCHGSYNRRRCRHRTMLSFRVEDLLFAA